MRKYLCCLKSALVLLTLATVACGGGGKKNNDPVPVSGVTLSPATLRIPVNGTGQLTATVSPNNATNKNYTWSVNNNLVTVAQNGAVTAGATAGNSTVTVTTEDGSKTAASAVSVFVPVTGVTISPPSITLTAIGQTYTLVASVQPGAAVQTVSWMSDSPSIASVQASGQSCVVTAVAGGTAIITATSSDDPAKTATCAVSVVIPQIIPVASVSLNEHTATLSTSGTLTLTASVSPQNASDKTITWASSAPATASISATTGEHIVVTALATGTTTIRAASLSNPGAYDECVVTVEQTVYVAGYDGIPNEWGYDSAPVLWTNQEPQILSDWTGPATSVFVSGDNKVYVTTREDDTNWTPHAMLYVDGTKQELYAPDNYNSPQSSSVFVAGDNVYVAGLAYNSSYNSYAILWTNGAPLPIERGEATSVYASEGTVYVAGYETPPNYKYVPKVWLNGTTPVVQQIGEASSGQVKSVFVVGSNVYAVGYEQLDDYSASYVVLWINGNPHRLFESDGGYPEGNSVYVSNGKAYVAGSIAVGWNNEATLWEVTLTANGQGVQGDVRTIPLTGGFSANSVFVKGNDVYAAGYLASEDFYYYNALIWKFSGETVTPTPLSDVSSEAKSIFVK